MVTGFQLCTDIIRELTTILTQLDLVLDKSKVTYTPSQQDVDFVRNVLAIVSQSASEIIDNLRGLGWKLGVDLFIPVVDGIDALSRAANANNTTVFDIDFLLLIEALKESVIEFRDNMNSFCVHAMREGMPFPLPSFAGTYLERYVTIVLKQALSLAISCLVLNRITPVPSPAQSSTGSPHSSTGRGGSDPMES